MKYLHYRKGFSMITAIVMIVLMSTVAMFVMGLSGKLIKETTAQYQREQAVLLANSYTEYSILAVTGNDRTIDCLETINGLFGDASTTNPNNGYRIRTQISYIGADNPSGIANCAATRRLAISNTSLTIIVDAYVDYRDLDNPTGPNLVYHRRTVQKI